MELSKAKIVQLDDELPGLLIPEGVQQDAAGAQGPVCHATVVAERQGFQNTLTDAPAPERQGLPENLYKCSCTRVLNLPECLHNCSWATVQASDNHNFAALASRCSPRLMSVMGTNSQGCT